jgi:hypothetical protein
MEQVPVHLQKMIGIWSAHDSRTIISEVLTIRADGTWAFGRLSCGGGQFVQQCALHVQCEAFLICLFVLELHADPA